MNGNRRGMTRLNVLVLMGVGVFGVLMLVTCADMTALAGERRATSRPTSRRSSGSIGGLFGGLFRSRETARRATCAMNLSSLGKGICLYQAGYREKFPAQVKPKTLPQGAINEEPEMVNNADTADESPVLHGEVKGNASVNAYYLLVNKGYVEEEGFKCPSDKSFAAGGKGTKNGRGYDLGFDGWKNLSYALQPTSINTADLSSRPSNHSKGSMILASDQVVGKKGKLTKTDNRPKENNAVNHGYGYVNVLLISNSVKMQSRKKGADSMVSKWGFGKDEIYALGMKGKAYPVTSSYSRRNDSILMGKQGGK
jgi:hypothetical protein